MSHNTPTSHTRHTRETTEPLPRPNEQYRLFQCLLKTYSFARYISAYSALAFPNDNAYINLHTHTHTHTHSLTKYLSKPFSYDEYVLQRETAELTLLPFSPMHRHPPATVHAPHSGIKPFCVSVGYGGRSGHVGCPGCCCNRNYTDKFRPKQSTPE